MTVEQRPEKIKLLEKKQDGDPYWTAIQNNGSVFFRLLCSIAKELNEDYELRFESVSYRLRTSEIIDL